MQKKEKWIIYGLGILSLCMTVMGAFWAQSKGNVNESITVAASNNWGLSFQEEGKAPVTNVDRSKLEELNAYYLGNENDKKIYLTFDAGYENGNTEQILDVLKENDVKAAFFLVGNYLETCPDIVKRMVKEGHIVGNHSDTHPVFPTITRTKMAKEVYSVHKYMQENFGYTPKYFRFPTGAYSHSSLELVTSIGYKSIFWSFAYKDWETANQPAHSYALEKIKGAFYPGSVLLLHAVSATNTALLPQIIDYGISQGYTFSTLDEYYAIKN